MDRRELLIQFEPLSTDEIAKVIERLVNSRVEVREEEERVELNVARIKRAMNGLAASSSNVRRLGKMADELISTSLVRALLDPPRESIQPVP